MRLSPRDSFTWLWLHFAGVPRWLSALEEAVALFRRSIENNRNNPLAHFFLAATLANLGKLEEAQSEAKAGLALDPGFSITLRFRNGDTRATPSDLLEPCARPGSPRNDRRPPTRRDPGRRRRRLLAA